MCEGLICESDIEIIKSATRAGESSYNGMQPTLKKWHSFDRTLRNELVKIRASRKHQDPAKYLREDGYAEPSVTHTAASAYRNPSVIEGEKILDGERWRALDELSAGHYFDLDFLIIYAHKLLILERWEKIDTADKARLLEETLART